MASCLMTKTKEYIDKVNKEYNRIENAAQDELNEKIASGVMDKPKSCGSFWGIYNRIKAESKIIQQFENNG